MPWEQIHSTPLEEINDRFPFQDPNLMSTLHHNSIPIPISPKGKNTNIPHGHIYQFGQGNQITQHMTLFGYQNTQGQHILQISTNTVGGHIPTYASHIHTHQHIPNQKMQYQQFSNQNTS